VRRIIGGAVSLVVCAASATACGGGSPEPSSLASKSSSPTPSATSASPTPTSPSDPTAFVRHYVQLINQARETGDASGVRALSDPKCEACRGVVGVISDIHADGGSYQGDPTWVIPADGVSLAQKQDPVIVDAYIKAKAIKVVMKAGAKPVKWPGGTTLNEFTLVRQGEAWKVREFVVR
jgi:uncharacterized protein DUF6318